MERYATDLTLKFWVLLLFLFMVIFQFSYLLACTTAPACQPEAIGRGMAIKVGSARREKIQICKNLLFIFPIIATPSGIQTWVWVRIAK